MIRRRITDLKKHKEKRSQEAAAIQAAAFLFIQAAEGGQISTSDITANAAVFPIWVENTQYNKGCLRRCPLCGDVFRCIEPPPVSERARNSRIPPSQAPKFWDKVSGEKCEGKDE